MDLKKLLTILGVALPVFLSVILYSDAGFGFLVVSPLLLIAIPFIRRYDEASGFLLKVFLIAFAIRALVAVGIVATGSQEYFGGDALAHEYHGLLLYNFWNTGGPLPEPLKDWNKPWGLHYMIAVVYSITGRLPIAINFISCFFGAMVSVVIFLITKMVYQNSKAAKTAALLSAFFPAMIIWSSQILKDGYIVFFIVLMMYALIKLQQRFSMHLLATLMVALFGIFSIRFYIFYFAIIAVAGSFAFGSKRMAANNVRSLIGATVIIVVAAFTGLMTVGTEQLDQVSNLDSIQYSRTALSKEANSGYGADTDIRTPVGAVLALPIGLINLLLAPFPWQFTSLRSAFTLPEMLVWWALFPCLILGARYTVRNRFREAIPILLFTMTLTVVYALFQTNVGTAYRQRTQVQVFLFIFIGVGLTIYRERRQDQKLLALKRQRQFERQWRE